MHLSNAHIDWAYDSTSISSYSEELKQVKYGKNKDGDSLPQINPALLFGEKSGLPFYYRKLAGNIPDVKTVTELIREPDIPGYKKVKLVMDRGYYSDDNINGLYKQHYKFLVGANTTLSYAKAYIKELGDDIRNYENYSDQYKVYYASKTITWDYTQDRPYKGDTITADRRMYLHLYYNPEKAVEDDQKRTAYYARLENELFSKYTLQGLLDELDVIECFTEPGKTPIQGEVLKKQEDLYTVMDVTPLYAKPSVETPGI